MKKAVLLIFLFSSLLCASDNVSDIACPSGYTRINSERGSYAYYVQHLPLKSSNTVYSFSGEDLSFRYKVLAVIDKPLLFRQDLEQCADYTMRFWADYHKETDQLEKLYLFNYSGEKYFFKNADKPYSSFLKYAMAYSNSYSIKAGGVKLSESELQPGDMFVQNTNGGIGHVSMIVDYSGNRHGERLYLIGYSFMPAQEFHIEKAQSIYGKAGWFSYKGYIEYLKKHLPYGDPVLRRF